MTDEYRSVPNTILGKLVFRLDRDDKLGALEERADALQDGAAQFEKQAAAMKNKFWLENLKMMVISGIVGVIVLGLLYWKFFMDTAPAPPPYYMPPPPPPPPAPAPAAGGDAGGGKLCCSLETQVNCFA